ncbi:hypothetical protein NK55_03970 [Thermosynechococcus sp. NK55a]|jgi:hypothetical protein|uniref:hypothetical protein n=1 Tax=unclassified Thermosynechococcus TaxID=2622553 RepID=UPI0003D7BFEB|nr:MULTISPECIES: hypothetical protein [unclassified Thermosynechococcus]AHB88125.1 hypothetical protein NK55_03970 [Thermosynechococcus sp. NK55a]HIK24238.1 hypothetical protein [Thermosynechococcus sp. M3746_W2019_013]
MRLLLTLGCCSLALLGAFPLLMGRASEPTIQTVALVPQRYQLLGLSFETPLPFSPPTPFGENGVAVVYPANAVPGEHELMVSLIALPKIDEVLGGLSDQELRNWLRFTQLGGSPTTTSTPVERRILGRRLRGEVRYLPVPRPIHQELYFMQLQGGQRLALLLEAEDQVPLPVMEEVFNHVTASLQELPPRSPAWKRSFQWRNHL